MGAIDYRSVAVLLIDVQTGFLELCGDTRDPLIRKTERLLFLAELLDLPVVATKEVPLATKGELPGRIQAALPATARTFTKATFDCMSEPAIRAHLTQLGRETVVVAGGETDVCVLLSVLSLLDAGYLVHLMEDCLFTSTPAPEPAIARMRHAGAAPSSVKTLGFELTRTVDRSAWPASWVQKLAEQPHLFPAPDDLSADQ